jgi:hypothetical protein
MNSAAFDTWTAKARAVRLEDELARRKISLNGRGREREGPCPICGGTDRFSINTQKQVWNCRSCGKGGDAIDLVRHLDGIDFIAACTTLAGEPPPEANGKDRANRQARVAEYPYHNADGELLFMVERIEYRDADGNPVAKDGKWKTFRQRRPDPDRPGQWLYKVDGVPAVPYRLPELLEAIAGMYTIAIVEGEGKVELLRSWNVPATCCSKGANCWTAEHAEFLRGAGVVILPDNDEPGRKFADAVGASLQGIAASVRVLELPGLPAKCDVVDWANAGGTVEQLHGLIAHQARPWTPLNSDEKQQAAEPPTATITALGEWDAGDDPGPIPPRQWLLANQFCCRFISSIVSAGGGGKSALRLLQFISLATGRPLCGQYVFRRCRVLLISLEDDRDELQRRIKAVLNHYEIERSELKGWLFCAAPKLVKLAQMDGKTRVVGPLEQQLRDAIIRLKPDLISLDPFVKTHALEENSSGDMDFVCDLLAKFAVEFNIAVDSPHHVHKGTLSPGDADSGRGSSGIRDAGRLVYTLTSMSEDEAKKHAISDDDRWSYIRLDRAKVNLVGRSGKPDWFRLVGVPIGNTTPEYPAGDTIQVVVPWAPISPWADIAVQTLNLVLDDIDRGMPNRQRYSNAPASTDRAVWPVVAQHCRNKTEAQCRQIIHAWLENGVLYPADYDDPVQRKRRSGLCVNSAKRPGAET